MGQNPTAPFNKYNTQTPKVYEWFRRFSMHCFGTDSIEYYIMLRSAYFFFCNDNFYKKVNIYIIAGFNRDVGYITKPEAASIILGIIRNAKSSSDAKNKVQIVLSAMRVQIDDSTYLSPIVDSELYYSIFNSNEIKGTGFTPEPINFTSPEVTSLRMRQASEVPTYVCHSLTTAKIIFNHGFFDRLNTPENLRNFSESFNKIRALDIKFDHPVTPKNYKEQTIFTAVENSQTDIIEYLIYNMPLVLELKDNGKSLLHIAAQSSSIQVIELLIKKYRANLSCYDSNGLLPFHLIEKSYDFHVFIENG